MVCLPVARNCKGTIYIKYPEQTHPQRQEADRWVSGAGGRLLMGMGFLLGVIKVFWT